jgi:thioredoxin reductase (NADPH)
MGLFSKFKDKNAKSAADDWLIPADSHEHVRQTLGKLPRAVPLELYADPGFNDEFVEFTSKFLRDLGRLSDKVTLERYDLDHPKAAERAITASPTVLFDPDEFDIRFLGAPAGEEAKSFIQTLIYVAHRGADLSETSQRLLAELTEPRRVKVFVSPTCPYCPGQVVNAVKAAVSKPDLVRFEYVEMNENPELTDRYNVGSVPHTVINEDLAVRGLEPEERFMAELVTLKSADELVETLHGPTPEESAELDLVILGGGPAGLSAGIYAARAGLRSVVLEKENLGGQVAVTPTVENYPGFLSVTGGKLVEIMISHAREYVDIHEFVSLQDVRRTEEGFEITTARARYLARALILATGATWRELGVPGEKKLYGHGVSHCSSCDGYIFKDKKVLVVGGGNTALTDALHLANLGVDVAIAHRRDAFRAQAYLQEAVERQGIEVLWNTVVTAIEGEDWVSGVRVKDVKTGEERTFSCEGLFIAIGEEANVDVATELGCALDEDGNVKVDATMRTSIPLVYAAGDVTGGLRQIVTATSQGATAAMTAFEDLTKAGIPAKQEATA